MALIFLVEDDKTLQKAYRSVLETAGYTVISALNGQDALLKYELLPEEPDRILLDHRMPEKEGLSTAQEMLAMNPGANIIFLSADIVVKHSALQLGTSFLLKPFSREELLSCIRDTEKQPLRHFFIFVTNTVDMKTKILPFLRHGFYRKEKCLYITCEDSIDLARKNLRIYGLDEESLAFFNICSSQSWLSELKKNPLAIIDHFNQFLEENIKGDQCLRAVIEIKISDIEIKSLLKTETILHKFIENHPNIRLMCAYHLEDDTSPLKSTLISKLREIGLKTPPSLF
ncbi:MAG: response regulator [Candidatus Hermodarchaeota archaeon]